MLAIQLSPGDKFGKLTVLRKDANKWLCECECGNIRSVTYSQLKHSKSINCGRYSPSHIMETKLFASTSQLGKVVPRDQIDMATATRSRTRRDEHSIMMNPSAFIAKLKSLAVNANKL